MASNSAAGGAPAADPMVCAAQMASAEELETYWNKLEELKKHKSFAESYIKTLAKFKPSPPNPEQQKVVDNVRNYLKMFLILCEETRERYKPRPHPLKTLLGCEKTLTAVLKRAATSTRNRDQHESPELPTTRMQKWGFLHRKDRWLHFDGQVVRVFEKNPSESPNGSAPIEVIFDMTKSKIHRDESGPLKFSLHYGDCIAQFVASDEQMYETWCRKLFRAMASPKRQKVES